MLFRSGFCFGGGIANTLAVRMGADLAAAVPYYGGAPMEADVPKIKAAVLVHHGGEDMRLVAAWPAAVLWRWLDRDAVRAAVVGLLAVPAETFSRHPPHGMSASDWIREIRESDLLRDSPDDVLAKGYPEGSTFINVRSNQQPGMVYPWPASPGSKVPAVVPPEKVAETFYPGCYVVASLTAYGFEAEGKKGPTFGLNNLQWVKDGERLDNRRKAEEEFVASLDAAPADLADLMK